MTKFVTGEQCLNAIQADAAWRKKEISAFKQRVARSDGDARVYMMRAGMVMLYAHWEGFVKFSAATYVTHINERIARFNVQLSEHYRNLILWRSFQKRGEYPHYKAPGGFLDVLELWKAEPASILSEDMVDTESNLNSVVLKKLLRIIDIPYAGFEPKENMIDEKLLGRRNPIAHGQRRDITLEEYQEADREVRSLLALFQHKIEECITASSYAAPSQTV